MVVAGQVLSVYGLGSLVGSWLGGWLCDRVGMIRIQLACLLLSGVGFIALGEVRTLPSILAATFLTAIAAEGFRPANSAALAAFSPPHLRTRAVALNRLALNLGFGVGPAVGGWLALYDYSWLFRVDGGTCLLAGLLLHLLFCRHRGTAPDEGVDAAPPLDLHPLKDRPFLVFLLLMSAVTLCFFQVFTTFPVYLREHHGIDESHYGLLMTLNAGMILTFEMILTKSAEAIRPLTVVGAGGFLTCLALGILPFGEGAALAVASMAILTCGEMLVAPFSGGWVANRAGVTHRGKYMGLYTMAWSVGFVAAPAAGAWLYQHAGPDTLWQVIGVAGVVIWVGFELLHRWISGGAARAREGMS
jgi:MFS family permease